MAAESANLLAAASARKIANKLAATTSGRAARIATVPANRHAEMLAIVAVVSKIFTAPSHGHSMITFAASRLPISTRPVTTPIIRLSTGLVSLEELSHRIPVRAHRHRQLADTPVLKPAPCGDNGRTPDQG